MFKKLKMGKVRARRSKKFLILRNFKANKSKRKRRAFATSSGMKICNAVTSRKTRKRAREQASRPPGFLRTMKVTILISFMRYQSTP